MNLFVCLALFGLGGWGGALWWWWWCWVYFDLSETMALPLPLHFWAVTRVMWKVMVVFWGGSVSPQSFHIPAPEDPCVAALGLSSGITSPKRDGIPRGFGGGDGESSPEPPLVSILGVLLSCLEVMQGQESFPKCVDSCTLCPGSQCPKAEGFGARNVPTSCCPWTLLKMRSRSLAPSPGCIRVLRWDKGWDVAKMAPNPAPNPSGCRVGFKEECWGRCWLASLQFSLKTFSCSSQNTWAFHITDRFRVWGVTFNPKVSWSSFGFVHLYYIIILLLLRRCKSDIAWGVGFVSLLFMFLQRPFCPL